jgi:hypothetical protein
MSAKSRKVKRARRHIAAARRERQIKAHVSDDQRLGFRLTEFAALIGISIPTLWRRVRAGEIRVIDLGGTKIIPRSEAVRLGLI